ncbi:MAG: hypothetical protein JWN04_1535, partial [Myxococcaceae bacterium]|nr:hypothetical protein [Myxococcaceae bacterium]
MVESRAREEDAFERAAAQLRPDWAGSQAPSESAPDQPSERTSVVAAAVIEAEPSVIVQPDIALLVEDPSSPQPELAPVRSGYGVPSAFSRTEATVLTRALPPGGYRALDPVATPLDGLDPDSLTPSATKRAVQLRWLAIGGAACVVLGIVVALFSRSAPEPVTLAAAPAVVAPVVQPLPAAASVAATSVAATRVAATRVAATPVAATPVLVAPGTQPAPTKAASASAVARSSAALAPSPKPVQVRGAKKKLAPPMRAAAKPAPIKPAKPAFASKPAATKP